MHWNPEYNLIKLAQEGDEQSLIDLFEKFKGLIITWTNYYFKRANNDLYDDIYSASKEGFYYAISKHDPDKGYLFQYATNWIRIYAQRALRTQPVSFPKTGNPGDPVYKVQFKSECCTMQTNKVRYTKHDIDYVMSLFDKLPERDAEIVKLRLGLDEAQEGPLKYRELSKRFKITPQGVLAVYKKSLKQIEDMYNQNEKERKKEMDNKLARLKAAGYLKKDSTPRATRRCLVCSRNYVDNNVIVLDNGKCANCIVKGK